MKTISRVLLNRKISNLLSVLEERYAYFWATQSGAELDLFYTMGGSRLGAEFKYSSAPSVTRSMRIAITDLKLDHLYVVYPGSERFPLASDITAIGLLDAMETWSSVSEKEPSGTNRADCFARE